MTKLNPESNIHLVTGMAGAGKSSSVKLLGARGYATINLDTYRRPEDDLRLCFWGTDDGTPAAMPEDPRGREKLWADSDWLQEHHWRWRPEVMKNIIAGHDHDKPLFLDGRARNQTRFFPYLGTVALLHITAEVLPERLDSRNDPSHTFGQHPVTRQLLIAELPGFEQEALAAGAVLLDTASLSPGGVADAIEDLCLGQSCQ